MLKARFNTALRNAPGTRQHGPAQRPGGFRTSSGPKG
jgi:hypothetical protein